MDIDGVLISFKADTNENTYYGSGILLDSDLVLVPGNILIPFTQDEGWVSSFLEPSTEQKCSPNISQISFHVFFERKSETREDLGKLNCFKCRIAGVWKCPVVLESINKLFSEWTLGHVSSKQEWDGSSTPDTEFSRELMSVFILLKQEDKVMRCNKADCQRVFLSLLSCLEEPDRGQKIEIVSTPFGNEHFVNSLSHGIISNVAGVDDCIILSDARTAPGCEGGPIFASKKPGERGRKLIGQVICSLSWWGNEWVGLTIGINLTPVLKTFLKQNDAKRVTSPFGNRLSSSGKPFHALTPLKLNKLISEIYNPEIIFPRDSNKSYSNRDLLPLNLVDETVVLIRSKTCWGSGIVLSATSGIIITCSHVVKNDEEVSVLYKAKLWPASVIFRSREDIAYDLAIVKTKKSFIFQKEIEFSKYPAEIGDAVFAAGFPFFSEKDDLHIKPTIVHGSVSKVNPYMIQTTCCIQSGFSGGALFKNGKLLGIIVSNTRDSNAGAHFPHINFIVPSSVVRNPVLKYIRQNDIEDLKELESSSSRVQLLWKLQTSKL